MTQTQTQTLNFTMQSAGHPMADGSYYATFNGASPVEAREWQGEKLAPGIRWEFTVTSGPSQGRTIGRITQATPTAQNACGKIISGLLGKTPSAGESISVSECVGKAYLVMVTRGRVESVAFPPQA